MIRRAAALVAAIVAVLAVAAPALADPAVDALQQGSAYVSPAVGGTGTADAQARLQAVADDLNRAGRPVRIAVVTGPAGAASMRDYAAALRKRLAFEGLLVAVAPDRPTGVAGPRAQAAMTRDLRAAKVGAITDPVQRADAAARAAAGPPLAPSTSDSTRALLGLLGIALIGGVWAAAFGIRRNRGVRREQLVDRTALARVRLDAIGARLDVLAVLPEHHARADDRLDAATRVARRAQAELDQATKPDEVPAAEALVAEAFMLLRDAEREAGIPFPDDYFEGLCRCDPAHGESSTEAPMRPDGITRPSCTACRDKAAGGHPQMRRMVPTPAGPIPFDETTGAP
ncbi:MAG: hypothetical protein FJW99_05565 [Actinobacteria bacterium]|nr:hypothetical protein [Actinomycetota bacterium]